MNIVLIGFMGIVKSAVARWLACGMLLAVLDISARAADLENKDVLTQVSVFSALLSGAYDGRVTCGELRQWGDTGLGTFDALDGEMIVLDSRVYKVRADGMVGEAADTETTPYAIVSPFERDIVFAVTNVTDAMLYPRIEEKMPSRNQFYVIRIEGLFRTVKTRSVNRQTKPYRPLVEVVKSQSVFEFHNVRGIVVGFWSPAYVKGLGVPGYHLHFIDVSKTKGGHLLAFDMVEGTVALDTTTAFDVRLSDDAGFLQADLTADRSGEAHAVEKNPGPAAVPSAGMSKSQ